MWRRGVSSVKLPTIEEFLSYCAESTVNAGSERGHGVSRMLVAYEKCGCAALALLDPTDEAEAERFRADALNDGLEVREGELDDSPRATRCAGHGGLS
jgi:hypothetical protein